MIQKKSKEMQNNLKEVFKNKKIVFFGTPDFTVDFLDLFYELGLNISLVVTGADKPVGRGMQMKETGPKVWALKKAVPFSTPAKLDIDFETELKMENYDLFIVIAYGKIIPESIINLPKHGTINLHYSLLPKYRGASPVESAILNNESETGITIQQMKYQLDAGDILYQEKIKIDSDDTTDILRNKLNSRALEIFPEFLENLFDGKIIPVPQKEEEATKCGKFKKEDLNVTKDIDNTDLEKIYIKYRTFNKKIYFFHGDKNIRVKITEMNDKQILKVIPESKKEMSISEFEKYAGKIFK